MSCFLNNLHFILIIFWAIAKLVNFFKYDIIGNIDVFQRIICDGLLLFEINSITFSLVEFKVNFALKKYKSDVKIY